MIDIHLERPCSGDNQPSPCSTLSQVTQELVRLQKEAKGNRSKLAILRAAVLEEMKKFRYDKEWVRLAKRLLDDTPKRKSLSDNSSGEEKKSPNECQKKVGAQEHLIDGGSGDFLSDLRAAISRNMLVVDPDVVEIVLATTVAHNFPGPPTWLYLIGPSGGGKTEMVNLIRCHPRVQPLSEVTRKTFFSGLSKEEAVEGRDPSFLMRHRDNILTFKDFTTMLSLRADDRAEIMGQLREIFDGHYDKGFGTGQETQWDGRITIIAGVTSAIDDHHRLMSALGPRFLLLRFRQPARGETAKWARQQQRHPHWRREVQQMVAHFIGSLPTLVPEVPEELGSHIDSLADFVTRGRSVTKRDNGELTGIVEMEMPSRLAQQFQSLGQGLALIHGRAAVDETDLKRLVRVGWETLPPARRLVLERLIVGPQSNGDIRKGKGYSSDIVSEALKELALLGMVQSDAEEKEYESNARWRLTDEIRQLLDRTTLVAGVGTAA